ncbi:hexaprenyl pyrophosphate synthase [Metallosphaera hakonensis]|uniref:Geranylgeranyl pyrophosphate synthase n=1 Tax=Metallosphaera hakonensis JCM 8857 = DSM 7519 TaxID=1293036 RepID=A0A2U9IS90_9CREN|nr:hexaprenyl pyrophosphate synthase [Metallosphaera hakonensis]AWR98864.1 polyprenyl synthetase family protein [Metallosphaera hakonensis JCM 8857 = DSM 7519]
MDLMEFWFRSRSVIDDLVEKFLRESRDWEVMEMSKYIMRDGKRFRGTLMFLFNGALGGEEKEAYPGALATEILHSASLALDDIVDYDEIRRGMKAAWAVYTNRKVIFVSNYLIPTALNVISVYGDKALRISVDLWKDTAVGALKDMYGKDEDYIRTVELKTASLFKLPAMLSSFSSGQSQYLDTLMEAGKDLGVIYQVIDDYVDCVTQEKEKLVGSAKQLYNLTSGKYESFVRLKYSEYKTHYEGLLNSLPLKEEYRDQLIALPDFLAFGLMGEAGIKNKIF